MTLKAHKLYALYQPAKEKRQQISLRSQISKEGTMHVPRRQKRPHHFRLRSFTPKQNVFFRKFVTCAKMKPIHAGDSFERRTVIRHTITRGPLLMCTRDSKLLSFSDLRGVLFSRVTSKSMHRTVTRILSQQRAYASDRSYLPTSPCSCLYSITASTVRRNSLHAMKACFAS